MQKYAAAATALAAAAAAAAVDGATTAHGNWKTSKAKVNAVFKEVIKWKHIDLQYPDAKSKEAALRTGHFIPHNNLPLGVHAYKYRIFVSLPKWKEGVPVTLGVVGKNEGSSPAIRPYPNWTWHSPPPPLYSSSSTSGASSSARCEGLTSVFRMDIDSCGRLWALDSGVVDAENTVTQQCPPQIVVFNLETDTLVRKYLIPKELSPDSSLLANIVVEIVDDDCSNAFAYLGDVFRYGLIVYDYRANRSWRVTHSYFYPDPLASDYILDGIEFQWVDGLFGMALSPLLPLPPSAAAVAVATPPPPLSSSSSSFFADRSNGDGGSRRRYQHRTGGTTGIRLLYFHPLSSYREFSVPTYVLRNESLGFAANRYFEVVGQPRGESTSHCTGSGMDRNGVLFYNLLTKSAVGCWNSNSRTYQPETQAILYQNNETLSFPNDLRVDLEPEQSVWILSNRLHRFLYDRLDPNEVNFRILSANARSIVKGTICDPHFFVAYD